MRAAVILLHAALENLLRSGEELRFLQVPVDRFKHVRWLKEEKRTLLELMESRGQTMNDVLLRELQSYLDRSNYNNEHDIVSALQRMGLDKQPFEVFLADLQAMMARRHWIAHRADVNKTHPQLTNPIRVTLVEQWLNIVESFGEQLLSRL